MGLRKTTETATGVTAEYWKLTRFTYWAPGQRIDHPPLGTGVDPALPAVVAELGLYVNRAAAQAGRQSLSTAQVIINVSLDNKDNLVAQVYQQARAACMALEGAEDVLD